MPDTGHHRLHLAFTKRMALRGLAARCRLARLQQRSAPALQQKHAVIAEPYGMGDVIALEPLVSQLAEQGWRVSVLAQQRWRSILPHAEVVALETHWQEMGIAGFLRFARERSPELRQRFSGAVGIDPRGDVRSIYFLTLCGCAKVLSLDHFLGSNARVPQGIAELVPDRSTELRRWQNNLEFLLPLGTQGDTQRAPKLDHLRTRTASFERRVGLIAVAPWQGRLWDPKKWSQVVQHLQNNGYEPVLLCGPGQEAAARVQAGVQSMEVVVGKDVAGLAEAIDECAAIITLDSGPMHLASALEKPLVALFGPGQRPLWAPFSAHSRMVVSPMAEGGPIHQVEANIEAGKRMMSAITVDAVIEAFDEVAAAAFAQAKRQDRISVPR